MNEERRAGRQADSKRRGQPARKGLPRGEVTVFPNWCKGCNLCIEFCPMDVLEQGTDGRVIVARPGKCTACRWCELRCPDFAIFVSDIEPGEAEAPERGPESRPAPTASEEELS